MLGEENGEAPSGAGQTGEAAAEAASASWHNGLELDEPIAATMGPRARAATSNGEAKGDGGRRRDAGTGGVHVGCG